MPRSWSNRSPQCETRGDEHFRAGQGREGNCSPCHKFAPPARCPIGCRHHLEVRPNSERGAMPEGATTNGAALQTARHLKEVKCWIVAVLSSSAWRLDVSSVQPGGCRVRCARECGCSISCGPFAASLVAGPSDVWSATDGCASDLADLFLEM